jgi:hypothetical protein
MRLNENEKRLSDYHNLFVCTLCIPLYCKLASDERSAWRICSIHLHLTLSVSQRAYEAALGKLSVIRLSAKSQRKNNYFKHC